MQRVRGEVGSVELPRGEATQLTGDVRRADAGRIQHAAALDERHDRAAGRDRGPATVRVERHLRDATVTEHQRNPHEVSAGSAAGAAHVRPGRHGTAAGRLHQVLLEGMHPPESRRWSVAQSPGGGRI